MYEPVVIFMAIEDIFYVGCIILYLEKDKIPFFNKHFVVFIWRDIHFLKKRKMLWHMGE